MSVTEALEKSWPLCANPYQQLNWPAIVNIRIMFFKNKVVGITEGQDSTGDPVYTQSHCGPFREPDQTVQGTRDWACSLCCGIIIVICVYLKCWPISMQHDCSCVQNNGVLHHIMQDPTIYCLNIVISETHCNRSNLIVLNCRICNLSNKVDRYLYM